MASTPDQDHIKPPSSSSEVPVLPLRDVVVYPHMVIPLFVGREKSIQALDAAMQDNKQILLMAQKSADIDASMSALFCAINRICLLSCIAASSACMDFSRPTNSGITMCG